MKKLIFFLILFSSCAQQKIIGYNWIIDTNRKTVQFEDVAPFKYKMLFYRDIDSTQGDTVASYLVYYSKDSSKLLVCPLSNNVYKIN